MLRAIARDPHGDRGWEKVSGLTAAPIISSRTGGVRRRERPEWGRS